VDLLAKRFYEAAPQHDERGPIPWHHVDPAIRSHLMHESTRALEEFSDRIIGYINNLHGYVASRQAAFVSTMQQVLEAAQRPRERPEEALAQLREIAVIVQQSMNMMDGGEVH